MWKDFELESLPGGGAAVFGREARLDQRAFHRGLELRPPPTVKPWDIVLEAKV